jgi:hypothetical protein
MAQLPTYLWLKKEVLNMMIRIKRDEMLNNYWLIKKRLPGLPLLWRGNEGEAYG